MPKRTSRITSAQPASLDELLAKLAAEADPQTKNTYRRFGIVAERALGVRMLLIRRIAKSVIHSHELAEPLWNTGIHEARLLATIIANPADCDGAMMERWIGDVHSWDLCDQCCINLFSRSPDAWSKRQEWVRRDAEFIKRAGFSLGAVLAVRDHSASDADFLVALTDVADHGIDSRKLVRKAANWSLRQIGKRNQSLHSSAVQCAHHLLKLGSVDATWIAKDALRELTSPNILSRVLGTS